MDADNIWCPVSYNGHAGWANAAYLGNDLQGHSTAACELYPKASGCDVQPGLPSRAAPSVPLWGPAAMPSANEPVWYTGSLNLMFRKAPDLTSGTVFCRHTTTSPKGKWSLSPTLPIVSFTTTAPVPRFGAKPVGTDIVAGRTYSTCAATTGN
jgi:hypothetical protein